MAYYKVSDLYERIHELKLEGYEYVSVDIIPADDEIPESVSFEAIEETTEHFHSGVDFDPVDSTELPANYTCLHL